MKKIGNLYIDVEVQTGHEKLGMEVYLCRRCVRNEKVYNLHTQMFLIIVNSSNFTRTENNILFL